MEVRVSSGAVNKKNTVASLSLTDNCLPNLFIFLSAECISIYLDNCMLICLSDYREEEF